MRSSSKLVTGIAVVVMVIVLATCQMLFSTKIRAIKESPGAFEGKEVAIAGQVTGTWNLLFVKYYKVRDDTDEIAVITEAALPREGDHVRVKGTVNQAFSVGNTRMIVVIERAPHR